MNMQRTLAPTQFAERSTSYDPILQKLGKRPMRLNPYDQLPYPTRSHPEAHIRKLEGIATLFGMHPKPVSDCRVLELGCAAGWNLIPQATEFPQSDFVGVELSERQVDRGRSLVSTLGLENIDLRQADLMGIDASWGQFDYILCHGVYSWVPEQVREKILEICKQALSPNGVAIVSYNVLPGWKFRSVVREMMLYHVSQINEPSEQVSQARAVLGFMAENSAGDTLNGRMLQEELKVAAKADDQYFFHEYLERDNHAVYFHEFMEGAEANGLQYLSDSKVASMLPSSLSPKVRHALGNIPLVKRHQYMDFISNRKFRATLLCHQGVAVNWNIGPELLRNFQLSLAARPEPFESRFDSKEPLTVRIGSSKFTINSPVAMAVFEHLSNHWPRTITIDELHTASIQRLAAASSCGESFDHVSVDDITHAVANIFAAGVLDFCVHPAPISNLVSSRPSTTPLARLQASTGSTVTNQRHENIHLDEFTRYLLGLLDSHHDLELLSDKVQTSIDNGELSMPRDPQQLDPFNPGNLGDLVGKALTGICNASLLTS